MKKINFLVLGLSFCSLNAFATELGQINVFSEHQATVDGINLNTLALTYRNHRRDLFWAYPDEAEHGVDFGAKATASEGNNTLSDYYGYSGALLIAKKFSPQQQIDLELGSATLVNTRMDQRQNILIGQIESRSLLGKNFESDVILKRDFLYQELIQPGAVSELITAYSTYVNLQYHLSEQWRILSRSSYRWFSDANKRVESDLAVMYGVSTGVPWIWFGLGSSYLSFQNNRSVYWSPLQFYSFGPRLEVNTPLIYDLSLSFGLNLNSQTELGFIPGTGYYGVASLDYGARDRFFMQIIYTRIQSYQGSNQWNDDALSLNLQRPL